MITTTTKRPKRRFLPLLTLIFLLGGLTFACSDLGQSTVEPTQEVLTETVTGPVNQPTMPNRTGGYYGETTDLQTSMSEYLKDIYQEIRYPAAARATGTMGKFRAFLRLGYDGEIERIDISKFTDEHDGGPPAFREIVVVGYPSEKMEGEKNPELLVDEIDRVLKKLTKFQPILTNGKPVKQTLNVDFNFILEE